MMGIESPVYQSAPLFCKSRASSSIGSLHISNSQSHGHGSISKQQKLYYSKIVSKCSFSVEIPRINCKPLLASAFVCRSSLASLKDDQEDSQRKVPDVQSLLRRFWKVAEPYWFSDHKVEARWRLAAVFALTLGTTGISVGFNLLGRDFYNAIANKDQEQFTKQLLYYLASFAGGIPVFVLRDYAKDTLSLRWRSWMTGFYMDRYLNNRAFYKIQSQSIIDNPDQRIVDDLSSFTGTALAFSLTLFNATVDLISFSHILYGIYPPLFLVLVGYSLGGTAISVYLGRGLVNLNFLQEKKEADFRYGLVRVRENAESIAFYDGEENEMQLLLQRFRSAFDNLNKLLISSRNLGFFTSGYRYLIQILPAAVVAPMYFSGKIEFGVINQSASAFNHILRDFSLIVYQFQAISAFSAVIDRLGEFDELLTSNETNTDSAPMEEIYREFCSTNTSDMYNGVEPLKGGSKLLSIEHLTLLTPSKETLIRDLSLEICENDHLLITGPSGTGKTSLLRALAGLWSYGRGAVRFYNKTLSDASPCLSTDVASPKATSFYQNKNNSRDVLFLPQKPYMVLGSLRQQLLYPTRRNGGIPVLDTEASNGSLPFLTRLRKKDSGPMKPTTDDLVQILEDVRLGSILSRFDLDSTYEWSSVLSVGEQQRLAFARLLLLMPNLVLLDESTSALDENVEALMYQLIGAAGITYVSIGHRRTLYEHHKNVLHISQLDPNSELPNWLVEPITYVSSASAHNSSK